MSDAIAAGAAACTRCGLCLQACPTYRVLHLEADSPRGRVFAIKRVADGEAQPDAELAHHLYVCLGCRACETACPSGVPFGDLLAYGRAEVERQGAIDDTRLRWRLFRAIAFQGILPNRALFGAAMWPARALQAATPLARALRTLPLPSALRRALAMIPPRDPRRGRVAPPSFVAARGARRARVAVFLGCVMDALFDDVRDALYRVLSANGCEAVTPRGQWCCGALNMHAGERTHALAMARRNVKAFEDADVDAIVVASAGCSAEMKAYGGLLSGDPAFAARAAAFAARVKDVSEFLVELGPSRPQRAVCARVTYQDACHLAHAQGVRAQPRAVLAAIPGVELVEMTGADRCCGAAGVYSITHPRLSAHVLAEKMEAIDATGADTVAVANPGCHMQLLAGAAQRRDRPLRIRHVVDILDEAYRQT